MRTTANNQPIIDTYADLIDLAPGTLLVDHSSGNAYRVVWHTMHGQVVQGTTPDGQPAACPVPNAAGLLPRPLVPVYYGGWA